MPGDISFVDFDFCLPDGSVAKFPSNMSEMEDMFQVSGGSFWIVLLPPTGRSHAQHRCHSCLLALAPTESDGLAAAGSVVDTVEEGMFEGTPSAL